MPKLEYFLAALSITDDKTTNLVSLFHVIEMLSAEQFPTTAPSFVAVSAWLLSEEDQGHDFQVTLNIRYADSQEWLPSPDLKVNFTADGRRLRIYHHVHGLSLDHPGELTLVLMLDGQQVAEHTVTVSKQAGED
ncbi:MAG: hypothetical protein JW888_12725 [Pirellulales bacterium]|nr:hypothetical protein [Pirellulales bacterium]